jgi:hypothetical protein
MFWVMAVVMVFMLYIMVIELLTIQSQNKKLRLMQDALIWMSGSDDFGPGGKAREGFLRVVYPLLPGGSPVMKRGENRKVSDVEKSKDVKRVNERRVNP